MERKRLIHRTLSCLVASFFSLLSACALFEIDKEVAEFEQSFGLVGNVHGESSQDASLIVVLFRHEDEKPVPAQYLIADRTDHYSFIVKEGDYSIGAFEDGNNNFMFDIGEPFGLYGQPDILSIRSGTSELTEKKSLESLDIHLSEMSVYPDNYPRRITDGSLEVESYKKLGVVTSLDDPVFNQENGTLGYWKPVSFLKKIGFGIYFLEEYDPDKIPVLFVHGANGTPVGWQPIVRSLDPERYQPWFFYYPSGGRLDNIATGLNKLVRELHQKYRFKKLYVLSHSMGGLVSRAFILKNSYDDREEYVRKFVAISAPWGGVKSAAKGVEHSPGVIPAWYDVAAGSEFLEDIYSRPFPEGVHFHLLFGTKGKCSLMMENNDGTLEIASEIEYRAQDEAASIHAIDEDHVSILDSERTMEILSRLFQE